jgi:hypothetical protein
MPSSVNARVVYQCCRSGLIEQRYETIADAAAAVGVARNSIAQAIATRTRCRNWYWRDSIEAGWRPAKTRRNEPVSVWVTGRRVTYESRAAASEALGMSRETIRRRMQWRGGHAA